MSDTQTIRLLLAEDHAIVREGLKTLLEANPCFDICGLASNGDEAVQLAKELKPDVILMDISMPEINGLDATVKIKKSLPDSKVIILTAHDDERIVQRSKEAGADGFLYKNATSTALAESITKVLTRRGFIRPLERPTAPELPKRVPEIVNFDILTKREREVYIHVAKGWKNREISEKLHISVKTVEKHRANLMKKLNIHNVAELVSSALKAKLITPDDLNA